jgi:DNA-3-methyladenine glycosylase
MDGRRAGGTREGRGETSPDERLGEGGDETSPDERLGEGGDETSPNGGPARARAPARGVTVSKDAPRPHPPAGASPGDKPEGPLTPAFYDRPVLEVARDLIGCTVVYGRCSGIVVETEAYHEAEPACHAYVGLTPRTKTLFGPPGRAYVYRSYGVHALLNAVCEPEGVGAAVLIRALEPLRGIESMRARRGLVGGAPVRDYDLCSGPGKLTQALAVELSHNDSDLASGPVRILAPSEEWRSRRSPEILVGRRVGINRAEDLPWRFCVAGNRNVSSPRVPVP